MKWLARSWCVIAVLWSFGAGLRLASGSIGWAMVSAGVSLLCAGVYLVLVSESEKATSQQPFRPKPESTE